MKTTTYRWGVFYKGKKLGKTLPEYKVLSYYRQLSRHVTGLELRLLNAPKPGKIYDLRNVRAVGG